MCMKRIRKNRSLSVDPLPPQVAWLDGISMSVTSLISWPQPFYHRVNYLLTVTSPSRNTAEPSTWHVVRSFDDFRFLRKRLVAALNRGHFCQAECPWLYTFLKTYYPTSHMVGSSLTQVIKRRRKKLTRSLATIQSFLLSRSNHVCPLVLLKVATELRVFVVGEHKKLEQRDCHGGVSVWLRHLLLGPRDEDINVEDTTSFDNVPSNDLIKEKNACALCIYTMVGCHEKKQKAATGEGRWSELVPTDSFSTLNCGHHFHDDCLIQKLNEAMVCPICGHGEVILT